MTPDEPTSITDTTNGRCTSGIAIAGKSYRCDYNPDHDGWAHSNNDAEAIWQDDVNWGDQT